MQVPVRLEIHSTFTSLLFYPGTCRQRRTCPTKIHTPHINDLTSKFTTPTIRRRASSIITRTHRPTTIRMCPGTGPRGPVAAASTTLTMHLIVSLAWASTRLQSGFLSPLPCPAAADHWVQKHRGTQVMAALRARICLDESMSKVPIHSPCLDADRADQGGRGACVGRFACCSIMTILFLLVSIGLSLAMVRPVYLPAGQFVANRPGSG